MAAIMVIICNQNGHVIAFDIFFGYHLFHNHTKLIKNPCLMDNLRRREETRRDNPFLLYLINLIKNCLLCDQNSHFVDP